MSREGGVKSCHAQFFDVPGFFLSLPINYSFFFSINKIEKNADLFNINPQSIIRSFACSDQDDDGEGEEGAI